jgi:hypothetical protein
LERCEGHELETDPDTGLLMQSFDFFASHQYQSIGQILYFSCILYCVYRLAEGQDKSIPHDAFYRDGYSIKNLVYLLMLGVILAITAIPHWMTQDN